MKRLLRLFAALLLLLALAAAGVWYAFPRYAQHLVDRALQESGVKARLHDPGRPGLSGVNFGRLDLEFRTPADSCGSSPSVYSSTIHGGRISWKPAPSDGSSSWQFPVTVTMRADSLTVVQKPSGVAFSDENPVLSAGLIVLGRPGATPGFLPRSIVYAIEDGRLSSGEIEFRGISYTVSIADEKSWVQPPSRLTVADVFSGEEKIPLSDFRATFGAPQDPARPCVATLTDCSIDLFGIRAATPAIEYDQQERSAAFSLDVENVPLAGLPGFGSANPAKPFATGFLSGRIPVEYRDSTIAIRNAVIRASSDTRLAYYASGGTPWLTVEAAAGSGTTALFENLNATLTLNRHEGAAQNISLNGFSCAFLGGTLSSGPSRYDPGQKSTSLTLTLRRAALPERLRLHGAFDGSLRGTLSGTVPLSLKNGGLSIRNARLTSGGSGSVRHDPPGKKTDERQTLLGTPRNDATYVYSEPVLRISRTFGGRTTVDFTLASLARETSGGELQLYSPEGRLVLWGNRNTPSLISLSGFSAGFMGGSVAVDTLDYDMNGQTASTVLILEDIPLQKLLDLQGMKKIRATGTVGGNIPVVMGEGRFEIAAGQMDAVQTGRIVYETTPEEREAANQSLRFTYEALSNFLYSELASSISMKPDGQSSIRLQLRGVNPSFQDGRPVHLNLNVEQNLLDLLRSLTISTSIEKAISEKNRK